MPDNIMTAASAAATTTTPTHRKCPYCRGNGKHPFICGMCENEKMVAICAKCHGAGTDATAAAVGVVAKCTACVGWGCVLPLKLYGKFVKREGGIEGVAVGAGVSSVRRLSTSLSPATREIREKAGRARARLEQEGA